MTEINISNMFIRFQTPFTEPGSDCTILYFVIFALVELVFFIVMNNWSELENNQLVTFYV